MWLLSPLIKIFTEQTKIYNDDKECSICFYEYEEDLSKEKLILKCGHIYHKSCVEPWLNKGKNCPVCRNTDIAPLSSREICTQGIWEGMKSATTTLAVSTIWIVTMPTLTSMGTTANDHYEIIGNQTAIAISEILNSPISNPGLALIGLPVGLGLLSAGCVMNKQRRQPINARLIVTPQ